MIEEKNYIGKLNLKSFSEMVSKKAMNIRSMLNNSNRNFSPCNVCDVDGTLMGNKFNLFLTRYAYRAWAKKILDISKKLINKNKKLNKHQISALNYFALWGDSLGFERVKCKIYAKFFNFFLKILKDICHCFFKKLQNFKKSKF